MSDHGIVPQIPFEINQMRYFVAAAEQCSFSQAANILHVSQPLISQQIAELERNLGVELFVRNRRSINLTNAGRVMLEQSRSILARISDVSGILQQADAGAVASGTLRIALEQLFDHSLPARTIFQFRTQHPTVKIHPSLLRMSEIIRRLADKTLDIGLCILPIGDLPPDLDFRIIQPDKLCLIASNRLIRSQSLREFALVAECLPCCLMERDFRWTSAAMKVCMKLGISPPFELFPNVENILLQVESGTGFSVLPYSVVSGFSPRGLYTIPLSGCPEAEVSQAALWNKNASPQLVGQFLDSLVQASGS